jgi:exosortase/archaeosortase family protein
MRSLTDNLENEDNPDKKEEEKKDIPKRYHNDKLMISTLFAATIITFLIYTVPDWVFLEIPTRNIISEILNFLGIQNTLIPTLDPGTFIPEFLRGGDFPFLEATTKTPGIHIPSTNGDYWIVKACTGMQAGGLLIAIILISEATWTSKIRASLAFFTALFIGNTLRITFHLWCVSFLVTQFHMDPETAFYWAHDVSSKVIGFFGTILFALIIEKMGVPIIDQFADWLDWLWWRIDKAYSYFM